MRLAGCLVVIFASKFIFDFGSDLDDNEGKLNFSI